MILVYSTFYGLPSFTRDSIANHLDYCNKHQYDYFPDFREKPTERQFSWAKVLLGIQLLESNKYEAIFWMDADSWFLNPHIRLEDWLHNHPEPIQFTGDENDVFNGGHFLLRNCPESIEWLKACWQICHSTDPRFVTTHKDSHHLFDQPGILAVLGEPIPKTPAVGPRALMPLMGTLVIPYAISTTSKRPMPPPTPAVATPPVP
ncbi:hypothetical protein AAF134_01395 [Synechococcus lacustris Tous-12m]